jgi:ribosomal protein S18 acetylase RimI-like enzyme
VSGSGALRRAESRDRGALAELLGELLADQAAGEPAFALRPDAGAELPGLVARQLRDPDAAVFVWEDAGGIAGFCSVRLERAPGALGEAGRTEITELAVRSARRRRGIGRALVEAACSWARARGARRVEVRVAARNAVGQAFWRALGYGAFVDVLQRRL